MVLSWYDGGLRPPRPPQFEPGDPMQDIIYLGANGVLNGDRLVPESRMERLSAAAKNAAAIARPLPRVGGGLPGRPAGGLELCGSRRFVDRDLSARKCGGAGAQETRVGRPRLSYHQRCGGEPASAPGVSEGLVTVNETSGSRLAAPQPAERRRAALPSRPGGGPSYTRPPVDAGTVTSGSR